MSTASEPVSPLTPTVDLEAEADLARCGALRDAWYVACRSDELERDRPLSRTLFGLPLVLFRGPDGAPTALRDRCLHRNARLSAGDVFDGKLGCPYHGWVYDASGRCVEIPSLGPAQKGRSLREEVLHEAGIVTAPCEVGALQRFETRELDGLIFVFPGKDVARARRAPVRRPFHDDVGVCSYLMVTDFPNGVTHLVENFMDVPHTAFVHRGWFRKSHQQEVRAEVHQQAEEVLVRYEQDEQTLSGLGTLFAVRGYRLEHTDHFLAPNVTRVDYRWGPTSGFVIQSQVTPIGPLSSRVYTTISYRLPRDLPGAWVARAMRPLVSWYTRQVITQDVDIMRIQSEGLRSGGSPRFGNTEADLIHTAIEGSRAWLRAGAQGAGPNERRTPIRFWI